MRDTENHDTGGGGNATALQRISVSVTAAVVLGHKATAPLACERWAPLVPEEGAGSRAAAGSVADPGESEAGKRGLPRGDLASQLLVAWRFWELRCRLTKQRTPATEGDSEQTLRRR